MKIAMLSVDYYPNVGGITGHISFLSQALRRSGHEVIVVKPEPGGGDDLRITERRTVRCYRVPVRHPNSRPMRVIQRALDLRRTLNWIANQEGGLDILHQHDHRTSSLAARQFEDARWVWTNHTSEFLEDYERPLRSRIIRWMYEPAEAVITVSREIQEKSRDLWPEKKVTYIPNGVDAEKFAPSVPAHRDRYGIPSDAFVVLCPRRLAPKNGVIFFARAARQLLRDTPDEEWHFVLTGSASTGVERKDRYALKVRELLATARDSGKVSFLGEVPADQMPEVNAIADVTVIPSLREAVSLSALEAMATGVPVVASDVGGLPEIISDRKTGWLVPPRDPGAIADAVRKLRRSPELRAKLSDCGRQLVEQEYGWDSVAKRTDDLYRTVAGSD